MADGARHSLHPLAVGVPLVAWTASLGFDLLSCYGPDDNGFARASERAILAGLAGAVISGVLGLRDAVRYSGEHPAGRQLAAFHAVLNLASAGFYTLAALRRGAVATEGSLDGDEGSAARSRAGRLSPYDAVSSAAALALLGCSGYVGGRIASRFNVRPGFEPPT